MHWIVIARDKPGMLEQRSRLRPIHREYIWREDLPARLITGAPLTEDDAQTMRGSFLLLEADGRGAVEQFLNNDPYTAADLFEKVEIIGLHEGFDRQKIRVE